MKNATFEERINDAAGKYKKALKLLDRFARGETDDLDDFKDLLIEFFTDLSELNALVEANKIDVPNDDDEIELIVG